MSAYMHAGHRPVEDIKKILILCEKTSQGKRLMDAAIEVWPDHEISCAMLVTGHLWHRRGGDYYVHPTTFIPQRSPSGVMLRLPKDLPISKVPMVIDPAYVPGFRHDMGPLHESLNTAERIIFACDADPRGAHMFALHMTSRFGTSKGFPAIMITSMAHDHLVEEFRSDRSTSDPWFENLLAVGEAKRFFDANWAANALPLFGKLLADCEVRDPLVFVSKYMVQAAFMLNEIQRFSLETAVVLMQNAPGSGKYGNSPIGTPTSRDGVLQNLLAAGILEKWGSNHLQFTAAGNAFVKRLHPDCEDPDLSIRLETWGETWPESRPQIERYIRTFFGKQKKFMSRF